MFPRFSDLLGLPPDLQKIMFKGPLKGDEKTLQELKLTNQAKLMLVGAPLKQQMAVATAQETAKELEKDPSDVKVTILAFARLIFLGCRNDQTTPSLLVPPSIHCYTG
jgi:hypothetical protein